jgi:serine/threonine protein kinase
VFYERDTPTPALIYAGKLSSLRTFMDKSYEHAWNRSEENRRPFDMDTTKTLQDVLAGLQHLHSKGLVHMDLTKDSVTVIINS